MKNECCEEVEHVPGVCFFDFVISPLNCVWANILSNRETLRRIMAYLKDDTELAAQLAVAVNISAQNKSVDIHPWWRYGGWVVVRTL